LVEIKLKWRIKKAKKGDKEYRLYYVSVPFSSAMFLLEYEPFLDPINKVIIFKPKQQNNTHYMIDGNIVIKLRWRIKKTKKRGKEYLICYINFPSRTAVFLIDYEPFLDPTNKVIIFRPKQNAQQNNTQNQPHQPQSQ